MSMLNDGCVDCRLSQVEAVSKCPAPNGLHRGRDGDVLQGSAAKGIVANGGDTLMQQAVSQDLASAGKCVGWHLLKAGRQ